ncbi:MAG: hypothetical protein AB1847_21280 [bacterium]
MSQKKERGGEVLEKSLKECKMQKGKEISVAKIQNSADFLP